MGTKSGPSIRSFVILSYARSFFFAVFLLPGYLLLLAWFAFAFFFAFVICCCLLFIVLPLVFGVWCLVFGLWSLVFDVWCLVFDVRCLYVIFQFHLHSTPIPSALETLYAPPSYVFIHLG